MPEDRDLGLRLNGTHERVATSRNHQINVRGREQLGHMFSRLNESNGTAWKSMRFQRVAHERMQQAVGTGCLSAAFEQTAVARADRQGSNLRQAIGTTLKDNQKH